MATPFLLLMPSYNQARYIVDAVNSILAQDDPDWELWVVDNSTDTTPEVMRQFTDPRIHFHHIPERMDPGSCLNWMLERARGEQFSYVHTDNNLHASYVRQMRSALAGHHFGLAYCNMRSIDSSGRHLNIYLRGEFDLARLLGVDSLGVPFAATVELARQLGGFSTHDFADDVRFCVSAFGLAHYAYICEPLIDYRLHGDSRTEEAGGDRMMHRVFVDLMPKILPTLEARGLQPLHTMAQAIREGLDDMDLCVEDFWYRKLSRHAKPWWQGRPRLDHFFLRGMLNLPGFSSRQGRPPLQIVIRDEAGRIHPLSALIVKIRFYECRRSLRRLSRRPRDILLTWACITLGVTSGEKTAVRIGSLNTRTLWAARQLELALGWTPLLDKSITPVPGWLGWGIAEGSEPLLDCAENVTLTISDPVIATHQ